MKKAIQKFLRRALGLEGASKGRRTIKWKAKQTSGRSLTKEELTVIINRSRDLVYNNSLAKNAMNILANNVVRNGIRPKFKNNNSATKHYTKWAIDNKLVEIQTLAMKTIFHSGSVLIRKIKKRDKNSSIPLSLQLIEPDRIATSLNCWLTDDKYILTGKEYNKQGDLLAYHLYKQHPADVVKYTNNYEIDRIPADEILHIYEHDRPDQTHGLPLLTQAIIKLRDYDEYQDAKLQQQKITSAFAAFVKGVQDGILGTGNDTTVAFEEQIEAGTISYIGSNDIEFSNPPNGDNGIEYAALLIREIASGLGISYEQLANDYSKVNFSSARMGRIEFISTVNKWQNILQKQMLDELYIWYVEAAKIAVIPFNNEVFWVFPAVPSVDEKATADAYKSMIRTGLLTQTEALHSLGKDPDNFYNDVEEINKILDDKKIIFDSDARKVSLSGTTNPKGDEQLNNNED